MKLSGMWPYVVGVALLYGVGATVEGARYSKRATAAQEYARAASDTISTLEARAAAMVVIATKAETVLVQDTAAIAAADLVGRPDSTCNQSIAARDSALGAAESEATSWKTVVDLQQRALLISQQADDSLSAALEARPKFTMPVIEALHPSLHLSLQALIYPKPQIGVGLSYDIVRVKL
jgi:hypothetical protein